MEVFHVNSFLLMIAQIEPRESPNCRAFYGFIKHDAFAKSRKTKGKVYVKPLFEPHPEGDGTFCDSISPDKAEKEPRTTRTKNSEFRRQEEETALWRPWSGDRKTEAAPGRFKATGNTGRESGRAGLQNYQRKNGRRSGAIELGLPDSPGFSEAVYRDLVNRDLVNLNHVNNLNDFKLLQISWVFDLNFRPTLETARSRRYLEMIREALPTSDGIDQIFAVVEAFLDERLGKVPDECPTTRPRRGRT
ncbi:MAG: hypothetical protein KA419_02735 [Acidobacteria bacterium]|nr:hypothetical protein [Acidobacteriota bacterium]